MRIVTSLVLAAALAACAPMPPPDPGLAPGLPPAWKDFTGTRRGDAERVQAQTGCVAEADQWANDRVQRTITPAAEMSGYAPAMMGAIDAGRHNLILRCMRTAGWEPA